MTLRSEFLRSCCERYLAAGERVAGLATGLAESQANWRPAPDRWSINECLAHLAVAAELYGDRLAPVIERARRAGRNGTEPYGGGPLLGRLLLRVLRQGPARRRLRSPSVLRPSASRLGLGLLVVRFHAANDGLIEMAHLADGLPLGRLKLASPVSPLVRLSAAQAFEILALHTDRHVAQAERVRAEAAFPG